MKWRNKYRITWKRLGTIPMCYLKKWRQKSWVNIKWGNSLKNYASLQIWWIQVQLKMLEKILTCKNYFKAVLDKKITLYEKILLQNGLKNGKLEHLSKHSYQLAEIHSKLRWSGQLNIRNVPLLKKEKIL